jgi:hypothetical protein
MSYLVNNIKMDVKRTFIYQDPEDSNNLRNNTSCVELRSADGRYSLTTDVDTFLTFEQGEA